MLHAAYAYCSNNCVLLLACCSCPGKVRLQQSSVYQHGMHPSEDKTAWRYPQGNKSPLLLYKLSTIHLQKVHHGLNRKALQIHNRVTSQDPCHAGKAYRWTLQLCLHCSRVAILVAQGPPQCFERAFRHALAAQAAWPWQLAVVDTVNIAPILRLCASADWVKQAVQQL